MQVVRSYELMLHAVWFENLEVVSNSIQSDPKHLEEVVTMEIVELEKMSSQFQFLAVSLGQMVVNGEMMHCIGDPLVFESNPVDLARFDVEICC